MKGHISGLYTQHDNFFTAILRLLYKTFMTVSATPGILFADDSFIGLLWQPARRLAYFSQRAGAKVSRAGRCMIIGEGAKDGRTRGIPASAQQRLGYIDRGAVVSAVVCHEQSDDAAGRGHRLQLRALAGQISRLMISHGLRYPPTPG